MSFRNIIFAVALLALSCSQKAAEEGGILRSSPESQGMCAQRLALIDSTVNASISAGDIPGAVVGIVRNGHLVFEKGYGYTTDTMFDLASLSKCVGTTLSIMQLVEQGKVRLVDPVKYYLPDFKPWIDPESGRKVDITVQDLMTHSSGLDAYLSNVPAYMEEFGPGTDKLLEYISTKVGRNFAPGSRQLYSCLNFITLQGILEKVTGRRLCDYAQENVFDALGLKRTCYFPAKNPARGELAPFCAPTEVQADGNPLIAQVHDPIARLINEGNSGNAGVFSTVEDLAVAASALLGDGSYRGRRVLSPLGVKKMFTIPANNDPQVARALGWDTYLMEPYSSGDIFPLEGLRGHTGYTGTSMILSPETGTAVIVLAHRVYPKDAGSTARLRSTIASIAASSIME